ncbi:BSD domain-containing protein [Cephalotus follicularis]|uniref:BSD domain-containing protein n=1 Tax=Cephalotus follicularis TaxID=3775 RepID=A0A1Q3D6V5_CEPFO|nr:BSD domain-containing protein [Cephalotus follicularis]
MSWLFKINDQDPSSISSSPEQSPTNRGGGGGGSLLGETIGRQLRGVASFLAPPSITSTEQYEPSDSMLLGIRNDLAEIGGSFKTGLSLLTSNKFSIFTSDFLRFQKDDVLEQDNSDHEADSDDVPGISEEVMDLVGEISLRPELWTHFPLSLDINEFKMSGDHREHALAIERVVPSLAALKDNLCCCMEEERFWIIYFILLLPRFNQHDFQLLSTPKLVETRELFLQKLQNKKNEHINTENSSIPQDCSQVNETREDDAASGKNETQGENISSRDLEATEIIIGNEGLYIDNREKTDKWLEESDIDTGTSVDAQKELEHEVDVSLSDLEDDDSDLSRRLSATRSTQDAYASSASVSNDWVQLNESSEALDGFQNARQSTSRDKDSEGEDWLTVDEFD